MTKRTRVRRSAWLLLAATIAILIGSLLGGCSSPLPAKADVGYAQNVQAVGEKKYVKTWTNYDPEYVETGCWLTLQRWVKVGAGQRPSFRVSVVLPRDHCTKGDGKGHCVRFANRASSRVIGIRTSG